MPLSDGSATDCAPETISRSVAAVTEGEIVVECLAQLNRSRFSISFDRRQLVGPPSTQFSATAGRRIRRHWPERDRLCGSTVDPSSSVGDN